VAHQEWYHRAGNVLSKSPVAVSKRNLPQAFGERVFHLQPRNEHGRAMMPKPN
jgi:hypothetical protein